MTTNQNTWCFREYNKKENDVFIRHVIAAASNFSMSKAESVNGIPPSEQRHGLEHR